MHDAACHFYFWGSSWLGEHLVVVPRRVGYEGTCEQDIEVSSVAKVELLNALVLHHAQDEHTYWR